jgi:hypothetical protein
MANKISVIIDVTVDKANRALSGFRKSVSEADGAVGKFKAGAASAGASLKANIMPVAAAAGVAIVAFAAKSVAAASDLEESTNAVQVSFGKAAEGVLEIGEGAAESMGLSKAAFNEAAVGFAAFTETIAGPGGDVAATLGELTGRASDFASVMNLEVSEAANVFRSALAGETEPIKKFGIDLSAASVEAYALANGLVKSKGEMTEAIKVQARYGLLMEKTTKFAGDFANTSGDLANATRIAKARITDFQAEVGQQLIPTVAAAVNVAMDLADVMERVGLESFGAEKRVGPAGFTGAVEDALNPSQQFFKILNSGRDAFGQLSGNTDEATTRSAAFEARMRTMQGRARETSAAVDALAKSNRGASDALNAAAEAAGAAGQEFLDARSAARRLEEQLNAIPKQTIISVSASTRDANASLDSIIGKLRDIGSRATVASVVAANRFRQRATGGVVGSGETTLVGERGPELVSLPAGSKVHTNQQSKGMLAGANTINLTVNAGLGTDGRDVGRLIVEELQKYQRRNGPGSLP